MKDEGASAPAPCSHVRVQAINAFAPESYNLNAKSQASYTSKIIFAIVQDYTYSKWLPQ